MKGHWVRRIWNWHLWMGVALLLPLLWWTVTGLIFSLWPIEAIRGNTLARGAKGVEARLSEAHVPPPHLFKGAKTLRVARVNGRALALVDRGDGTDAWDLEANQSLGPVIPPSWAQTIATRDLANPMELEAIYLLPREGDAQRVLGTGPERLPSPAEYAGPRPAYAVHFAGSTGLHLYVDALDGQVRARRRALWRFYDLAFRLHSFEFTGDGLKRGVMLAVCVLWLALGTTGGIMAWRRLKPSAAKKPHRP